MPEYIDRDVLLLRLKKVVTTDDLFGIGMQKATSHAIECIEEAPTADVAEVVHSYWVNKEGKFVPFNEKDGCPARSCYCHRCKDWLTASDEYPCCGNYCPNCGAKMDGKENDHE